MRLSKNKAKKLRQLLPVDYLSIIKERVNKKHILISLSTVKAVLRADRVDHHGIIDEAIKLAEETKKQENLIIDKIDQL